MPRFTDALLDAHRKLGDPPADAAVATLLAGAPAHEFFFHLRGPDDPNAPRALTPSVTTLLGTAGKLPTWYVPSLVRVGEDVFARHGPAIVTGLFCSSLPNAYACANGAEVLVRTGRMTDDLHLRIDETAQMVFDVCAPGGLSPDGRGVRTLAKVRLIHAAIRLLVSQDPTFDVGRLGVPINQEDLAGTMLTFSRATGRAVERLGGDLSTCEWEGWLHLWRVAGSLLGVPDDLMPATQDESTELWRLIMRRQHAPSLAGRKLTQALVEHIDRYLPGQLWDGLTAELMRTFLGDRVGDWLGVPPRNWTRILLAAGRWWYDRVDDATDASPNLARATGVFNTSLLHALAYADRGGTKVKFDIPHSLKEQGRSWRFRRPGFSR